MPPQSEDGYFSSLGLKIHKSRGDHFHVSADTWLEEKGNNDGAEELWRIHDDLYDFSNFIDRHPGGSMWLKSTKGTDITEAFESHHITLGPEKFLQKFHIRKAVTPRNSPFTFHEDGFYRQLKKQVREVLKDIPKNVTRKSKFIADGLFLSYVITAIFATRYMNYYIGTLSGIFLAMVTIAAHNFFHQKDSFRMYYFDLSLMSSREWRISHALSHHLYTNTIIDMEIQMFEPIMQFLPMKKSFIARYVSWIYCPLFYMAVFTITFLRRTIVLFKGEFDKSEKAIIIPFIIPILMYIFGGRPIIDTILIWAYIVMIGSTYFGIVGINAGHHRPDVFHDGDTPRAESIDWGISQLDAAMDRLEINGSDFLVLTNFGDHGLHHLFPTMDHGMLKYLYPTFKQVCAKFGVELRMASQLDMIKGTFKQLANTTPNPLHPGQKRN